MQKKIIFLAVTSMLLPLLSEAYGQTMDQEWVLVVKEFGIEKTDTDKILKEVEDNCLSGQKCLRVIYKEFGEKLQEYKGRSIMVADLIYVYCSFDISLRMAKVEMIDGEYAEVPLPNKSSINIKHDSIDSIIKIIRSYEIQSKDKNDLQLSITAPRVVYLLRGLTATITITNDGDKPVGASEISIESTKSLDYISSSPAGIFFPRKDKETSLINWQIKTLGPKLSAKFEVMYRGKLPGSSSITARFESKDKKWRSEDKQARISIIGVPDMDISTYDTEDPVDVGKQTVYVIEARNEGTSPCTEVEIVDTIPDEMSFISATPTPVEVKGNRIIFPKVANLEPCDKITIKVVCKATKPGSAKNVAELKYAEFPDPIRDEEGTNVYE